MPLLSSDNVGERDGRGEPEFTERADGDCAGSEERVL